MKITHAVRGIICLAFLGSISSDAQPLRPAPDYAAPEAKFRMTMRAEEGSLGDPRRDYVYTEADVQSFLVNVFDRGEGDGLPDYVEINFLQGRGDLANDSWFLTIGSNQTGKPLQPGTYDNATRAPFAEPGTPGLDLGLNGRGCNRVTGRFTITAIEFDCRQDASGTPQPHLKRLEMEFEHHCEGSQAALRGNLSLADDSGIACSGGGTPGPGTPTPPPPPPPPNVRVNIPAHLLEESLELGNDGEASFEISTSTLESFEGDVHLSVVSNAPEVNGLDLEIAPVHIPPPGVGTAMVRVKTGPLTLPRNYLINVIATTNDERSYASPTVHLNLVCDVPMILAVDQPKGITVTAGETAALSTKVLGSGPLRYQWYRGPRGSTRFPVAGANSATLTINNAAESNPYWVRVSNACGSVDSHAVFVTVR